MNSRVLLADDDVELCEEIGEVLTDEGFRVHMVHEGNQVPDLIRSNNYDVVILDYKMSGLNGIEILRQLKNKRPGARIYLVSGRPFLDKLLADEGMEGLITERINKPFDARTLLDKIRSAPQLRPW